MSRLVYNILVSQAEKILPFLSPFSRKLKHFNNERVKGPLFPKERTFIKYWFHCASLGEYEMARPVIDNMTQKWGQVQILITFFSPSGFNQSAESKYEGESYYLPLDTVENVKKFYKTFRIENAVFVRYDVWYNFVKIGLEKGTHFFLLNSRFQPKHKLFSYWGKPYVELLHSFDKIFCSDQRSASLLRNHGFENVTYTGDIRMERVFTIAHFAKENPEIESFKNNSKTVILGSSWPEEEAFILPLLAKRQDFKLIIAPHDVGESRIKHIESTFKDYKPKKYSDHSFSEEDRVLIIDNIGMLAILYKYGEIAVVGGGFKGALHNIMEPAIWGNAIFFGPKTDKFPEAVTFEDGGFGFPISDEQESLKLIENLLENEQKLKETRDLASSYVLENRTALQTVVEQLN